MSMVKRVTQAADTLQQHHTWVAFPIAVWKKFGDDEAGNLAALIAYYAFFAIFPLLLVLVTVLDIVLKNHPSLRESLLNSALSQYPVIGPQLGHNIGPLHQSGLTLVIGLVGTFIGARGVASAMQNALNSAWEIPIVNRPGFPWSWLRSFGLILVVGLGLIGTTTLSVLAGGAGRVLPGAGGTVAALAVSLILNFGVFWLAFRLGVGGEHRLAPAVAGSGDRRRHLADPAGRGRLFRLSSAGPRLAHLRYVRGGDRAARLALPAGGAHPVRGGD